MDKLQRKTLLGKIAQTQDASVLPALEKEADKISTVLTASTNYTDLEDGIDLLDAFAYRLPEKAFSIVESALARFSKIELTFEDIPGFSEERLKDLYKPQKLVARLLKLLKNIRYYLPEKIFHVFLNHSISEDAFLREEGQNFIKSFVSYNLEIFYGDGKTWRGFGAMPQQKAITEVEGLSSDQRKKYFDVLIIILDELLDSSITGTTAFHDKMVFQTGAVPATNEVINIRGRAISYLRDLYELAETTKQKRMAISTLNDATRPSSQGRYGDDVRAMIFQNTIDILGIFKHVVDSEQDLEIIQHIEHLAYWLHRNRGDDGIRQAALLVKESIDTNEEYKIFKVLIGFEGVFKPWSTRNEEAEQEDKEWENELQRIEDIRNQKTEEYSSIISEKNFDEWRERILSYAKIDSNDFATFPFFAKFLEQFSQKSPRLALDLIKRHSTELERFLPCFIYGLLGTDQKQTIREMLLAWIDAGEHLIYIARVFEFQEDIDVDLINAIMQKALEYRDDKDLSIPVFRQLVATVTANYNKSRKPLINTIFLESVRTLTALKDAGGLLNIWFRKEAATIINDLDVSGLDALLENLLTTKSIDYHAEQILTYIAQKEPEKVIAFFGRRFMAKEESEPGSGYNAAPYEFHSLHKPLSLIPDKAVDIVASWYKGDYGLFIYRGAKLLYSIFPDFPLTFQTKLIGLVHSLDENKRAVVMAVLRNYDGDKIIHDVCKELIKNCPVDSDDLNEIAIILDSTGVVEGDYGFVRAYEQKKTEMGPWLSDGDEKIREFAQKHVARLDAQIDWSKKRADEDVQLRKYKYGSDEG